MKKNKKETTQGANVAVGDIYDYKIGSKKKPKNSMIKNLKVDTDHKSGKYKK